MKKVLVILTVAIAAVSMFVGCKNGPEVKEPTNVDYFVESYNAADFVMNDFVHGVWNYEEKTSIGDNFYPMNYCYSATTKASYNTDPLMNWDGSKFLNLFTNEAKTKRVGISKFTNYSEYDNDKNGTVNGLVIEDLQRAAASGINLEFKYKDQTSTDGGKTWNNSGDEKTGYLVCNANRTKVLEEGSTTKYKYTVTDLNLSVRTIDGEFLDVSSKDTVSYKKISYVIDGTDLSTLEKLTCDDIALTAEETAAVIKALSK